MIVKKEIHCDYCPDGSEFPEAESFGEVLHLAKKEGWIIFLSKNKWVHACPSCKVDAEKDL